MTKGRVLVVGRWSLGFGIWDLGLPQATHRPWVNRHVMPHRLPKAIAVATAPAHRHGVRIGPSRVSASAAGGIRKAWTHRLKRIRLDRCRLAWPHTGT